MKSTIAIIALLLVACNSKKTDFTKITKGMDTVQVSQIAGQPTERTHIEFFGRKMGIWIYKNDTALVTFINGKVGGVMKGVELKEEMQKFEELKKKADALR